MSAASDAATDLSLSALVRALSGKRCSSREVTEACLARIAAEDGQAVDAIRFGLDHSNAPVAVVTMAVGLLAGYSGGTMRWWLPASFVTAMAVGAGLGALTGLYHRYSGQTASYEDVVYERKKQAIEQLFFGEMRALGAHLARLAVADRNARDLAPSELLAALIEVTACMPVYRTYIREGRVSDTDRVLVDTPDQLPLVLPDVEHAQPHRLAELRHRLLGGRILAADQQVAVDRVLGVAAADVALARP